MTNHFLWMTALLLITALALTLPPNPAAALACAVAGGLTLVAGLAAFGLQLTREVADCDRRREEH